MNRYLLTVLGLLLAASPLAAAGDWSVDVLAWDDGGFAGAGISLRTRVHYLDLDAGSRRERMEDRLYVSLSLRW